MATARNGRRSRGGATAAAILTCLLAFPAGYSGAEAVPLWTIEGAQNRVYLLGSIHLLREGDYPLPEAIGAAYADAERVLMELDMDDVDRTKVTAIMFSRGTPPEGETLSSLMGAERFERARRAAAAAGIDLDRFQGAEPWYAALTLTQMQLMRQGYDPRFGLDTHVAERARRDGKPIEGLETFEEQIRFFDDLPVALQSDMLLESLAEIGNLEAGMDRTVAAWRTGEVDYLAAELLQELRDYPDLYERLVVERNRRWLPRIRQLLAEPADYLVVVGALHLVGEDGLIRMLADSGIESAQAGADPPVP